MSFCSYLQDNVTVGPSDPATVGGIVPPKKCVHARAADCGVCCCMRYAGARNGG
jgi:hypothetical protein